MSENQAPDARGAAIISNEEYGKYIAELAGRIADERSARREAIYRALLGLVIGAIAFLGYSNIQSLKQDLNDVISARLTEALNEKISQEYDKRKAELVQTTISQVRKDVDAKLAFIQLTLVASELDRKKDFSPADRDAAVSLLRQASQSEAIRATPEFRAALEQVLDSFVAAELDEDIDQLDEVLSGINLESRGIVITLVMHYGMRVIGEPETSPSLIAVFQKYVAAAHRHGMPDLALSYRIGWAFRQSGGVRTPEIDAMFQDAMHLNPRQSRRFIGLISESSKSGKSNNGRARMIRSAELYDKLRIIYATELAQIEERGSDPDADDSDTADPDPSAAGS